MFLFTQLTCLLKKMWIETSQKRFEASIDALIVYVNVYDMTDCSQYAARKDKENSLTCLKILLSDIISLSLSHDWCEQKSISSLKKNEKVFFFQDFCSWSSREIWIIHTLRQNVFLRFFSFFYFFLSLSCDFHYRVLLL